MEIRECISSRRSVRSYEDKQLPRETVEDLISLGIKAATGSGMQPWGFVVIQDKDYIKELSEKGKRQILENLDSMPYLEQYQAVLKKPSFCIFNNAPTLLVIFGDTSSHWHVYDCTLAAGNIMLAAHAQGIGSCWIGFAQKLLNEAEFKKTHAVPDHYELVCPLGLGYSKTHAAESKRKEPPVFSWK